MIAFDDMRGNICLQPCVIFAYYFFSITILVHTFLIDVVIFRCIIVLWLCEICMLLIADSHLQQDLEKCVSDPFVAGKDLEKCFSNPFVAGSDLEKCFSFVSFFRSSVCPYFDV